MEVLHSRDLVPTNGNPGGSPVSDTMTLPGKVGLRLNQTVKGPCLSHFITFILLRQGLALWVRLA